MADAAKPRELLTAAIRKQLTRATQQFAQAQDSLGKAQTIALADPGDNGEQDNNDVVPVGAGDEWVRLAKLTNLPVRTLQRALSSPSECKLVVSRLSPSAHEGRKVYVGEYPELTQDWPFDLQSLKKQIAEMYGGELWRFSVVDPSGRSVRDLEFRVALPPREAQPLVPEEEEVPSVFGAGGEPSDPRLSNTMDDLVNMERKRAEWAAVRNARRQMESESTAASSPAESALASRLDRMLEEMRAAGSRGGGQELAVLVEAMRAQSEMQASNLKLMVESLGAKMSAANDSQARIFEIMSKSMDDRAKSQSEVLKVQMEAKQSEMNLIMRIFGERREEKEMTMDKMLELINIGMQFKHGGAEGEDKGDWLSSAINALTSMITNQAMAQQNIPALPAPGQAGAPEAPDPEKQRLSEEIRAAAQVAAQKVVMRARAKQEAMRKRAAAQKAIGRSVPASTVPVPPPARVQPPPAADAQRVQWRGLTSEVLELVILEMEEMPPVSEAVQLMMAKAPEEWRSAICANSNSLALAKYFQPYADQGLLDQIKELYTKNPERGEWLMRQAAILRGAVIRQHEAQAAAVAAAAESGPERAPVAEPEPGPEGLDASEVEGDGQQEGDAPDA